MMIHLEKVLHLVNSSSYSGGLTFRTRFFQSTSYTRIERVSIPELRPPSNWSSSSAVRPSASVCPSSTPLDP